MNSSGLDDLTITLTPPYVPPSQTSFISFDGLTIGSKKRKKREIVGIFLIFFFFFIENTKNFDFSLEAHELLVLDAPVIAISQDQEMAVVLIFFFLSLLLSFHSFLFSSLQKKIG